MGNSTEEHTTQIQDVLVRMDRNYATIKSMSKKLGSYTYEPRDPSCFEKLYNLKLGFRSFMANQNRISALLQNKSALNTNLSSEIGQHLQQFSKLERDIAAYLLENDRYLGK